MNRLVQDYTQLCESRLATVGLRLILGASMSIRRKRRRASQRRIAKITRKTPISIWAIIIIALVVLAVSLARTLG